MWWFAKQLRALGRRRECTVEGSRFAPCDGGGELGGGPGDADGEVGLQRQRRALLEERGGLRGAVGGERESAICADGRERDALQRPNRIE
eukprot:6188789-Pleurochrysis_carterae.AAC.1